MGALIKRLQKRPLVEVPCERQQSAGLGGLGASMMYSIAERTSTVAAITYPNLKSIHVIESSQDWVNNLKVRKDIQTAELNQRLHFHMVNIGKTKEWGYPVSESHEAQKLFHLYPSAVDGIAADEKLDFVLVDGRFRVACFLHALKHADDNTIIAIHDYDNHRDYSKTVPKYADTVKHAGAFYAFKLKANIDLVALNRDIEEHDIDAGL